MDFINGNALLTLCMEKNLPISEVMKDRELHVGGFTQKEIDEKMTHVIEIMEHATHNPLENPQKSIGGLIGGEAKAVVDYAKTKKPICGDTLSKAIAYAMAVLEVNASMGLIVAAPTAGSSGNTSRSKRNIWIIGRNVKKRALSCLCNWISSDA